MNKLREIWQKYLSRINKYWFATLIILSPTLTIGDSSLFKRMSYNKKIRDLEKEIVSYLEKIERDRENLKLMDDDPNNIEKFAREQYFMKRDNEDVFLFNE